MKIDHLQKPLFIAHRGLSRHFPENTLSAFKGAMDAGAYMIELDVTLTKDRQLVVIHDDTVDRTTNGTGAVKALNLRELTELDAGSWFDQKFGNERLPTLAQVLETTKGSLLVNIEIKPEAFEPQGPEDAVERQVLGLVTEYEMTEEVLVSCFHWQVLEKLRKMSPDIALGLLSEISANADLFAWCRRFKGFSWHPDYRILTRPQVEAVHKSGMQVFPYTVKGKMDTCQMLEMGVDGLIVDDSDQMTANMKIRAKRE